MGHTNSTTNYNLPQFLPTDKPAWLTDINGAFTSIDTGMKNAKDTADSAQNDATQALTDAGAAATAAATADAKASGSVASIANAFDSTAIYNVGDLVMYNNLLYICSVAVVTPGPWTGSTNWSRITIEDKLDALDALKFTEGSSGVWSWRKYANGTFELWGFSVADETNEWNAWGSVFSSNISGLGAFPFTITSFKSITGSCIIGGVGASSSLTSALDNTNAPGYIAIRGTTLGTGTRTVIKSLHAVGTYPTT